MVTQLTKLTGWQETGPAKAWWRCDEVKHFNKLLSQAVTGSNMAVGRGTSPKAGHGEAAKHASKRT